MDPSKLSEPWKIYTLYVILSFFVFKHLSYLVFMIFFSFYMMPIPFEQLDTFLDNWTGFQNGCFRGNGPLRPT